MRYVLCWFCFSCIFLNSKAEDKGFRLFGEFGMGKGNYTSFIYGLRGDFLVHHSISVHYYSNRCVAENVPATFKGLRLVGDGKPKEKVRFLSLSYGRIIDVVPDVKLNLKAGILGGRTKTFDNFQLLGNGYFFIGDNYSYDTRYTKIAGISLNPSIEAYISQTVGFSLGGYAVFTNEVILYGVELTALIF